MPVVQNYLMRGHGMENILSLSGRIPIWLGLVRLYEIDFYTPLGYGFQMLSEDSFGVGLKDVGMHLTMAHNNFLQVLDIYFISFPICF